MSAHLVGQVSIGQCIPTTAALVASALADFNAKLAGALAVQAAIAITPPTLAASLSASIQLAASLQASLTASIALGLPNVSIDVTAVVALLAELNASIAALLALSVTLGTAGVYVFTQSGAAQSYGADMQAQVALVALPGNTVRSVTFLATDPAVFEALGKVLLTG